MISTRPVRSLADIQAVEERPVEEQIAERNTYDVLRRTAAERPNALAIRFLHQGTAAEEPFDISYRHLFRRVTQTANLLGELGLPVGGTVSYLLPNLPETHYALWGGEAAGIANPINPLLAADQIADIMEAGESRALIAAGPAIDPVIWEKALQVRQSLGGTIPIIVVGGDDDETNGVFAFDQRIGQVPGDRLVSGRVIAPDDIASYFHTGGTTGTPKLAQHSHWGETFNAWATATAIRYRPEDVILTGLPLFHVAAVMMTGLAAFMAGATTVMMSADGFRNPNVVPEFWNIAKRYQATMAMAVPTVYSALLDLDRDDIDYPPMRYAICGAAPMPVEVFRRFEARTGIKILEGYGATEATTVISFNPPDGERRVGSVGLRLPFQDVKAIKVDDDGRFVRDCAANEQGVVVISGPNVFPGYKQDRHNKNIWPMEGWFNTGDLGHLDEDGYMWLTGRAKDLIIRGGHNIDPEMIENALHQHPAVALASAVGKPDDYAGELPVAYVVLKPGAEVTADALKDYARAHVAERPAAPADIHIIDTMPTTAVGKIFKPALRYDAIRRVFEAALASLKTDNVGWDVSVGPDETLGTVATVTVNGCETADCRQDLRMAIDRVLNTFTVAHRVVWV